MAESNTDMRSDTHRQRDILLMLFAVQFSLFVVVVPGAWPLLMFPVLLTGHVMFEEYKRRHEELER